MVQPETPEDEDVNRNPTHPPFWPDEGSSYRALRGDGLDARVEKLEKRNEVTKEKYGELARDVSILKTQNGFSHAIAKLTIPALLTLLIIAVGAYVGIKSTLSEVQSDNRHIQKNVDSIANDIQAIKNSIGNIRSQ